MSVFVFIFLLRLVDVTLALQGHAHNAIHKKSQTLYTDNSNAKSAIWQMKEGESTLSNTTLSALHYERISRTTPSGPTDPFYNLPSLSSPLPPPGTLLRLEKITNTSDYTIPPNTGLSRFVYISETLNGTLVPVSGFILWPFAGRNKENQKEEKGCPSLEGKNDTRGNHEVIAWAHGTSGISGTCAPSHYRNLWQHFLAPYQLVLNGYVVVATDYAGLGVSSFSYENNEAEPIPIIHEYISNPSSANDVIHSITAARTAFPLLIGNSKFVVAGHSQGGGAAWAVAQREVQKPTEGYLGSVAVSPVTSFLDMEAFQAMSFGIPAGLGVASIFGNQDTEGKKGFELSSVFLPPGLKALRTLLEVQGCNAVTDSLFLPPILNGTALHSDWKENEYYRLFSDMTLNGGKPISGPLLVIHGEGDQTINITVTEKAVRKTRPFLVDGNGSIEFLKMADSDHTPALTGSQSLWMDWIGKRFEGKEEEVDEVTGYRERRVEGIRGTSDLGNYQGELNWFVGLATEGYETD